MEPIFQQLIRRLTFLFLALISTILLIAITLVTYKDNSLMDETINQPNSELSWDPKKMIFENPKATDLVKEGYSLVSESSKYMGPLAEEPSQRFAGNNLSCTNCHLNGGTQSGSASWIGILDRFPQFRGRENKIGTIKDRINGCMERSLNGVKLPNNSNQMNAIIAYIEWISSEIPEVNLKVFKGFPNIKIPNVAVNLDMGKQIYTRECVLCHGSDGEGIRYKDDKKGYQYPPLWGEDSYNDGAGMHRVITAAAFIKNNMPYLQASWDDPKLSDLEAFHVAGYINSFSRPKKNNKENDFPDRKLKPVSTPYGPWSDTFSPEQHKYGPFPPIIAYYKKTFNLNKTK
ncbi:c-type cytochrome [Flavobacteriaceae bacterium]|nr:c-type cytochrome [Flavobacteriaceae bacterium]